MSETGGTILPGRGTAAALLHVRYAGGPGPITPEEGARILGIGPPVGTSGREIDGESACEPLTARAETAPAEGEPGGFGGVLADIFTGRGGRRRGVAEAMVEWVALALGSQIGRTVVRGLPGSILER